MQQTHKITKGVIAVAGSGTRFLPATKSLPKEMLPIVDRPIVHYVVEEMVQAGITDIVFVTRADKKVLDDYFDRNFTLEYELKQAGKTKYLKEVERISQMANFISIRQKGPYGNGTPVLNAQSFVGDEPFVFAFGDDLVKSAVSFTKQLLDNYEHNQSLVVGCQEVEPEEVSSYGIIKLRENSALMEVEGIVEKPKPEDAPSRLSSIGRFILFPEICEILKECPLGKGGELWLTDAIQEYIRRGHRVTAQAVNGGRWYTTGDPLHFLEVTLEYALDREEYGPALRKLLQRYVQREKRNQRH
ncbi:UTP--glucose-1-phosphate uridylyltransferase [candidate division KSB3 bacterium]|uniref:UTP--glucose-1-phosphate uridylyltransferase n=1 Tax=candidate division KSB3 bacterium TaxID=2044937 RepID=A0A2G6E7I0_9BACT|nr:MAG: UTP--glucose-1-phosphate uridylyltransferase [candidate division KSB3 bacterium]PIE30409.1 MAG: UTP--glucose-1-phosphate uridylyltransferase [candidate division KSB3 bacterium]